MIPPGSGDSGGPLPSHLSKLLQGRAQALELHLNALADSLLQGENPSSLLGRGMEVTGAREYQNGDEARSIDWRVTARRDRLYVKEFSAEKELPVLIVLHRSPTLWAGRGGVKAIRALETCGLLATLGDKSGDRVGLILSEAEGGQVISPGNGRMQVPRIVRALLSTTGPEAPHGLKPTLQSAGFLLKQRARVFIVGDFQMPETDLEDLRFELRRLRERHLVLPVRIRDQGEAQLPLEGSYTILDPISGKQKALKRRGSLQIFIEKLRERNRRATGLFRELGLELWEINVEEALTDGLKRCLLQARVRPDPKSTGSRMAREAKSG